jgi:hypothetical protein
MQLESGNNNVCNNLDGFSLNSGLNVTASYSFWGCQVLNLPL